MVRAVLWTVVCLVPLLEGSRAFSLAADAPATASTAAKKPVIVIAHRGFHKQAPENTLAALEAAIAIGCDYVEVDVRRTQDGALVIMHDSTVERTTDGQGKVAELTLAQIRKLSAGANKGPQWRGEKIPTFDEVLGRAKGRIKIYVDHKQAPPAEVLAAINKHGMLKDVVVYGSVETLREYKKRAPGVWIMPDHPGSTAAIEALVRDLHPETLDGNLVRWYPEQIAAAHRLGVQVWVDTPPYLDTPSGLRHVTELGIEAVQTDNPEVVIELLEKLGNRPKRRK
jgi:glycerophosphoryl diester phosphodiesterase